MRGRLLTALIKFALVFILLLSNNVIAHAYNGLIVIYQLPYAEFEIIPRIIHYIGFLSFFDKRNSRERRLDLLNCALSLLNSLWRSSWSLPAYKPAPFPRCYFHQAQPCFSSQSTVLCTSVIDSFVECVLTLLSIYRFVRFHLRSY
jgi:hypothetical protein